MPKMTRFTLIILLVVMVQKCSAQTFDDYTNELFFKIFTYTSDTAVSAFLHKYVPILSKKPETGGSWTAYPPDYVKEPAFLTVTNAYVFTKHPYFKAHFTSGKLEITQKTYADKHWIDNIQSMKLWFDFNKKIEAKEAYEKLVNTFTKLCTLKRLSSQGEITKAEFTDKNSHKLHNQIQFLLAKDNFEKRSYKILLEIGNDLY